MRSLGHLSRGSIAPPLVDPERDPMSTPADEPGGLEYGTHTGVFQSAPHRQHPVLGRVTVMGRTTNQPGEWTVKTAHGVYSSLPEAELLALPAPPA